MLDFDLAELYEVATKALNQAVKRNNKRFPEDFMFRLTALNGGVPESQSAPRRKSESGGNRLRPHPKTSATEAHQSTFLTEQGIAIKQAVS